MQRDIFLSQTATPVPVECLRAGDIVSFHAGTFRVLEDAWPALNGTGPSPVVVARAECLTGSVMGYYSPGSIWGFQGRAHRVEFNVINR